MSLEKLSQIHLLDGRISPDKAIKLVCKLMKSFSDWPHSRSFSRAPMADLG